jgi:hypothetical protein
MRIYLIVAGIYVFFVVHGVLLERARVNVFQLHLGSALLNIVLALLLKVDFSTQHVKRIVTTSCLLYASSVLCVASLSQVSYTTQLVIKSFKPIAFAFVVGAHNRGELVLAFLATLGIIVHTGLSHFSTRGISMLLCSMALDTAAAREQQALRLFDVNVSTIMFFGNIVPAVLSLPFVDINSGVSNYTFLLCVTLSLGQLFVNMLLTMRGPLLVSSVVTMRKMTNIVIGNSSWWQVANALFIHTVLIILLSRT